MSYSLQSFDLATLDTLLISQGVDPIATGLNDFLNQCGDTRGVQDTTDLDIGSDRNATVPGLAAGASFHITTPGTYSIDTDQYPVLQAIILRIPAVRKILR